VDYWAECDLAWDLADAISVVVSDRERSELYTIIGGGDSYRAIDTLLGIVARVDVLVSPDLVQKLTDWLAAYAGSMDAARLRVLLDAVRSS